MLEPKFNNPKTIKTSIIPSRQNVYGEADVLDYQAICVFSAIGFFLNSDTYWKGKKVLPPASVCQIDSNGHLVSSKPYFKWHHTPSQISFAQATDEFTNLFETIVSEQVAGKKVILPLSGGLDSRTQATALKKSNADVTAYSYSFSGGHDETIYSQKIAQVQDFCVHNWKINSGYLWDVIEDLAVINLCYSEFTHPRQMAFYEKYSELGDVFSLGHWGDVLFDDMGVPDDLSFDQQINVILKKIIKKGGLELGNALWKAWGIEGNFNDYLYERVKLLYSAIDIPDSANARIRAFKSMYWAPRWTSINLSIFESLKPVSLPYYDDRICKFICTIPEKFLSGRKIQIEYLKCRAPELSRITWQEHRPFNLYNYKWDKTPWNLSYRLYSRLKRSLHSKSFIERNWELQFLGAENEKKLEGYLFDSKLIEWIPTEVVQEFFNKFKAIDSVYYSHSVSMLLTLSLFSKHFK